MIFLPLQMALVEWLVHWAVKFVLWTCCSTRSSSMMHVQDILH